MVFRSFSFWILVRLFAVMGLVASFFILRNAESFPVTAWSCLALAFLAVFELLHFVNRYNRQLVAMVQSLVNSDFNLGFANSFSGKFPSEYAVLLTVISERFQGLKIQEESKFYLLQHIVDDISFAVLCFNAEGKVILHNAAASEILGYKGCINLSGIEKNYPSLYAAITQREAKDKVVQVVRDDQISRLSFTCKLFVLFGAEHRLVTLSDIQPLVDEQEQESLKKVIKVLTHEIMNSIAPIASLSQSFSAMAQGGRAGKVELQPADVDDMLAGYRVIGARSASLIHFVDQFRRFTRVPSPVKAPVLLDGLISRVARLSLEQLEAKGIALKVSCEEGISCSFDEGQIEQVLLNLVVNAADALAGVQSKRIVEISGNIHDGKTSIVVSDNGVGISESNLDQVFIPFFSTKSSGSGIGLSLAREIVQQHGGSIAIRSRVGVGTKVILTF